MGTCRGAIGADVHEHVLKLRPIKQSRVLVASDWTEKIKSAKGPSRLSDDVPVA